MPPRKRAPRRKKSVVAPVAPTPVTASFTNFHLLVATAALVMAGTAAYIAGSAPLPTSAAYGAPRTQSYTYGYNNTPSTAPVAALESLNCVANQLELTGICEESFKGGSFTCANNRIVRLPGTECKTKAVIEQTATAYCKSSCDPRTNRCGVKVINYGTSCGATKYNHAAFTCARDGSDTSITGNNTTCLSPDEHQQIADSFCNSLTCRPAPTSTPAL